MSDLTRLVVEAGRRQERELSWHPEKVLFDKQLAVFNDDSPYRLLSCGRRSGKSYTWAIALLDEGYKFPKSKPLFMCLSRSDAKDIIWEPLDWLNEELGLGLEFNLSTSDVTMPNGSRITVRGAGSMREINKVRGKKYPCCIVDEAQAFGADLYYLLDEALEPATADYHGWIGISGTPNVTAAGPFYEMCEGDKKHVWSQHHWTFFDNPTIPEPEVFIKRVMARRGWTEENDAYKREYLGQWILDYKSRAFSINPPVNVVDIFPEHLTEDWTYTMGIDVGFNDPFAWVVVASSQALGQAYAIDCHQESEITTIAALSITERFCEEYPINEIALDTGGGGKLVEADWTQLTDLPIQAAKKTHKASQVSVINGDLDAGKLKICRDRCMKLIADLMVLEWDSAAAEQNRWWYRKGFADHLADALQYGYSLCEHHRYDPERDDRVAYGSHEFYEQKEDRMEQQQIKAVREREKNESSIFGLLQ